MRQLLALPKVKMTMKRSVFNQFGTFGQPGECTKDTHERGLQSCFRKGQERGRSVFEMRGNLSKGINGYNKKKKN